MSSISHAVWFPFIFWWPELRAFLLDRCPLGQGRSLGVDSQLDPRTCLHGSSLHCTAGRARPLQECRHPGVGAQHAAVDRLRSGRMQAVFWYPWGLFLLALGELPGFDSCRRSRSVSMCEAAICDGRGERGPAPGGRGRHRSLMRFYLRTQDTPIQPFPAGSPPA